MRVSEYRRAEREGREGNLQETEEASLLRTRRSLLTGSISITSERKDLPFESTDDAAAVVVFIVVVLVELANPSWNSDIHLYNTTLIRLR